MQNPIAKIAMPVQNPIDLVSGYGVQGMVLRLNLQQCQKLGSIYRTLQDKEAAKRSPEEEELGGLLQIFSSFAPVNNNTWDNLQKGILELIVEA